MLYPLSYRRKAFRTLVRSAYVRKVIRCRKGRQTRLGKGIVDVLLASEASDPRCLWRTWQ